MSVALPLQHDQRDWVHIDEVARLTGLSVRNWRFRAPSLAKQDKARQLPNPDGAGRPAWHFHRSVHPRLGCRKAEGLDALSLKALSGEHCDKDVRRAELKLKWLRAYWQASSRLGKRAAAARIVTEAKAAEGDGFKISLRALQMWDRAYYSINSETGRIFGVDGLIDRYGLPRDGRRSPQAEKLFYTLYHTEGRNKITKCHAVTLRAARRNRWYWPPSVSATRTWLKAHDDRELTLIMRHGGKAYAQRGMTYIEQDYAAMAPGELYVCDHHQLKYFVLYHRKPIRPWLTAIEDARTRLIVGWHLGPAPHSDSILQSIRMAFTRWGIPEKVKIDNGRDYTAKLFTGLTKQQLRQFKKQYGRGWKDVLRRERDRADCRDTAWFGILPELGCEITYAIPYCPWSKLIERWFRTFTDQHARTRASFCDTSAHLKPEGLSKILARPEDLRSLDAEREAVGQYIDLYHAAAHTGDAPAHRAPREIGGGRVRVQVKGVLGAGVAVGFDGGNRSRAKTCPGGTFENSPAF